MIQMYYVYEQLCHWGNHKDLKDMKVFDDLLMLFIHITGGNNNAI